MNKKNIVSSLLLLTLFLTWCNSQGTSPLENKPQVDVSIEKDINNVSDKKEDISWKIGDPLLTTGWLNEHLNDKDLVILDVRSGETEIKFEQEHIPGSISVSSVYFQTDYPSQTNVPYNIPPKEKFEEILQKLGINQNSKIVIVYPGFIPKDIMCGTRTYWTLAYYGIEDVSILNGGLGKWKKDGYQVTDEEVQITKGNFKVQKINSKVLANSNEVKNLKDSKTGVLLDARMQSDYIGKTKQDFIPEYGHIEWSVNYFAPLYLNSDLTFKSVQQITYEMALLGIKKDSNIITYCNSWQFATTAWFALSKIAEFSNVSSYDGSISEWVNKDGLSIISDIK